MNYKSIVLITLALCLCITMPVAAVWQNGNWIEDANAPSVQYDPTTGVSSKYAPIVEETDLMSAAGLVYGNLKSGSVLEGGTRFLVSNDLYPESSKEFFFSPDGTFQDYFVEGNFTITLPQGTGSATGIDGSGNAHPEIAHVKVVSGQVSYFTFIGNSVSSPEVVEKSAGVRDITICTAFYRPDLSKTPISGHVTLNWRNNFGIANVKSAVRALVNGGQSSFEVSNDNLGVDPAYGWYKHLDVTYAEGDTCSPKWINRHLIYPVYHYAHADEGDIITL